MYYRIDSMKTKQKALFLAVAVLFSSLTMSIAVQPSAQALNPIQVLVQQKCSGSADSIERCGENYSKQLKNRCGSSKNTKKYRDCARSFAESKGATLKNNSCWSKCESNVSDDDGDDTSPTGGGGTTCGGVDTAILQCDDNGSGVKNNAIWGLLEMAISILTAGIGLVAVGGLIYAGILYATASGNASQVTKAKETIFNIVLGIVLFALMWSFLQFIIPGGIFG